MKIHSRRNYRFLRAGGIGFSIFGELSGFFNGLWWGVYFTALAGVFLTTVSLLYSRFTQKQDHKQNMKHMVWIGVVVVLMSFSSIALRWINGDLQHSFLSKEIHYVDNVIKNTDDLFRKTAIGGMLLSETHLRDYKEQVRTAIEKTHPLVNRKRYCSLLLCDGELDLWIYSSRAVESGRTDNSFSTRARKEEMLSESLHTYQSAIARIKESDEEWTNEFLGRAYSGIASVYIFFSDIYQRTENLKKALEQINVAESYFEKTGNIYEKVILGTNKNSAYFRLYQVDPDPAFLVKAIEGCMKTEGGVISVSRNYPESNDFLSVFYLYWGDYLVTLWSHENSLENIKKAERKYSQALDNLDRERFPEQASMIDHRLQEVKSIIHSEIRVVW